MGISSELTAAGWTMSGCAASKPASPPDWVIARYGRTSDVKIPATELVALFQAQKVDREALAALLVFHEAAALEAASVSLVRRAAVLERSRHRGTRSESIDPR